MTAPVVAAPYAFRATGAFLSRNRRERSRCDQMGFIAASYFPAQK
jgi:hypothetical protein